MVDDQAQPRVPAGRLPHTRQITRGTDPECSLTRSLALELAGTGVTVNCVAPGPVRTPMNDADRDTDAAVQAAFTAEVPVGRWGMPAEVAHVVLPLLNPGSAYVTGSVWPVDGRNTAQWGVR